METKVILLVRYLAIGNGLALAPVQLLTGVALGVLVVELEGVAVAVIVVDGVCVARVWMKL